MIYKYLASPTSVQDESDHDDLFDFSDDENSSSPVKNPPLVASSSVGASETSITPNKRSLEPSEQVEPDRTPKKVRVETVVESAPVIPPKSVSEERTPLDGVQEKAVAPFSAPISTSFNDQEITVLKPLFKDINSKFGLGIDENIPFIEYVKKTISGMNNIAENSILDIFQSIAEVINDKGSDAVKDVYKKNVIAAAKNKPAGQPVNFAQIIAGTSCPALRDIIEQASMSETGKVRHVFEKVAVPQSVGSSRSYSAPATSSGQQSIVTIPQDMSGSIKFLENFKGLGDVTSEVTRRIEHQRKANEAFQQFKNSLVGTSDEK